MRRAALAVAVLGVALGGGSLARATTGSGNENPDLAATAALVSDGADPEVAQGGDKIHVDLSITNTTDAEQLCHVFVSSDLADKPWAEMDKIIKLKPGHTWKMSHKVNAKKMASGTYMIVLAAVGEGSIDPSLATATIVVDNDAPSDE
jgi:uncharacterized protein YfaS (alpha-2-macroglobulin family)